MKVRTVGAVVLVTLVAGIVGVWYAASQGVINLPGGLFATHDTLKILVAKNSSNEFLGPIIEKYGIDAKHGLDLTVTTEQPGDIERRYYSKEFPMAFIGVVATAEAHKKDVPSSIIAASLPLTYRIVVKADSPIKTLADLKGKVLGVLPKTTAAYLPVVVVLRSAGLNPDTDLTFSFGGVPDINQRLLNGEIDAGIVSYPAGATLYASGKVREIANLETVWEQNEGVPLPFVVLAARNDWYEENKRVARKFIDTFSEAQQMLSDRPEIFDEIPSLYSGVKVESPSAKQLLKQNIGSTFLPNWTSKEVSGINRFFERSVEYGLVSPDSKAPAIR